MLVLSAVVIAEPREDYYLEDGLTADSITRKSNFLLLWSQQLKDNGVSLPVELYPTIVRAGYADFSEEPSEELDGYANELLMLQDTPDKLGTSKLDRIELNGVGEKIEITQTYTVGMPLSMGAGILVAKHWQHDIRLQADNERLANYVTAVSNNPDVLLKMKRVVHRGIHGSPFGLVNLPLIEIVEGELQAGDEVTIRYGVGRNAIKLPDFPVARMTLPLYFRTNSSGHFYTIPVEAFSVVAGAPARISVVAPSIIKSNQLFSLFVRIEDKFGNLAQGRAPSLEIVLDGVFQRRIDASFDNVTLLQGLSFKQEGLHNITVRSGGGGLVGYSNPILVRDDLDLRIHWANLHGHSNRSDGLQSPEEIEIQSKGLFDLTLITDHDNYLPLKSAEAREVSLPLARGGHRLHIPYQQPIVIALPEIPMDHRSLFKPSLVEIQSGSSGYEWFGQYFAGLGYRIGFTASPTSHIPGKNVDLAQTAILIVGEESWQQAVTARRTFVTSGPKSILLMRVNGGNPGSRIELSKRRHISGEVFATTGIDAIELIRNGMVIDHYRFKDTEGSLQVKVTMGSDSKPLVPGWDTPRNGREWLGYLRVIGARISSIKASGIEKRSQSAIAINPAEPARVDFITWTHGTQSSFVLSLDEIADQEVLFEINIKEGFEDVDLLPGTRDPAVTPGIRQLLSLDDIGSNSITRATNVNGYSDFVRFELTNTGRSPQLSFSFVDTRSAGIGDYYYVRVKQTDDHMLWSSPVYIGGFDVQ
ncbi:MAG: hypothetical protein O6945_14170 [Gammaproteobacteria bacterium]|nr:hypothetical protein [Gammaproteobacteria bacterium]